jgi:hypothetical protein
MFACASRQLRSISLSASASSSASGGSGLGAAVVPPVSWMKLAVRLDTEGVVEEDIRCGPWVGCFSSSELTDAPAGSTPGEQVRCEGVHERGQW